MTTKKKKPTGRHANYTPEFKAEAVRLVRTSGRSPSEIAWDLGVAVSTLGKWVAAHKEAELLAGPHMDTAKELARLRHENELLRQERDLLKTVAGCARQRQRFWCNRRRLPVERRGASHTPPQPPCN